MNHFRYLKSKEPNSVKLRNIPWIFLCHGLEPTDPTPTAIVASDFVDPSHMAIAASGPVPNTGPLFETPAIVEVLHDPGFNFCSAGGRRSVDEQTGVLLIGPLR